MQPPTAASAPTAQAHLHIIQNSPIRLPSYPTLRPNRNILHRAPRRSIALCIRTRQHRVQERRGRGVAVLLLLAVGADGVTLIQNIRARGAVLGDQRVRVRHQRDLVLDGLVREHGHLRHAVQAHDAVLVDDGRHLGARDVGEPVDEVEVDVLKRVGAAGLAEGVVLRREEVRCRVGALGGGGQAGVEPFFNGGPLADEADDGGLWVAG